MRALWLSLLACAGCLRTTTFKCTTNADCANNGVAGECQSDTGFCSFPDPNCSSGQRYGDLSGSVANQCVGAQVPVDAPPDAPAGFHHVGGTVSGLSGSGLVLRDNGSDDLAVSASGPFTFATALMMGQTYSVSVGMQPSVGICNIAMGTGTIASADVTNVAVSCTSGGDPGIFCGGTTFCTKGTQVCCNPQGGASCTTSAACSGSKMTCDDAADCGGGTPICCSRLNGGGVYQSTQCQSSCGAPNVIMCDPTAASPCAGALTCKPFSKLPSGYYACQ